LGLFSGLEETLGLIHGPGLSPYNTFFILVGQLGQSLVAQLRE